MKPGSTIREDIVRELIRIYVKGQHSSASAVQFVSAGGLCLFCVAMLWGIITDSTQQYCSFSLSLCSSLCRSVCLSVCPSLLLHFCLLMFLYSYFPLHYSISFLLTSNYKTIIIYLYTYLFCLFFLVINLHQFSNCLHVFLFIYFFLFMPTSFFTSV